MQSVRESWTDERLDDLSRRVDEGFGDVREELRAEIGSMRADMNRRFASVDSRLDAMNGRLDGIQRAMVFTAVSLTTAIVAGFGGMIAVLATKL
jgi:tetrahydromethanopterin S-methyltransferase subunit G